MTTTLSLKCPGATSFDFYLCGASLSSAGFPPSGGHTVNTVKGLLRSELDGHVTDESDLSKMKFTNSIFRALIHISSLQIQHIEKIKYHKKDGSSVYIQKKWNFNHRKKSKTRNPEKDNIDIDVADDSSSELEALGSHDSTIFSQGTDRHGSDDEFNGSISPIKRYWSAEFASSPIPDPYNTQKPDVALFYYKNKLQEKRWADVLSFVEHTSSNLAKTHDLSVYWGSATKAYLIMREQPWCRFVLAYSICADDLRVHYFDHSGLIISLPTPIHKFPICVTKAIATTALADPQYFGLDPTIHVCIAGCQGTHLSLAVGAKGWVVNNSGKTYSIMDVLWKSQGFFCHGMVCYHVRDPTDGKDYAMKDCWVPEAKRYHEVAVLERVKGIPNVIQLVDHWDVMYDGKPDCTARIRDRYQQFDPDDRGDHRFCNRFHRRLVMTPCGEPLSDFSSRKELICAFRDFVIAHRLMVECGILDGDLSPNNFIIHEGIGYFIDFDHAGFIEEGKTSTISFGTGTIPYISMRVLKMMLRNAETMKKTADATQLQQIQHYMCDDLESMFYIFFEFVTKYGGARGILAPTWDKLTMPWSEAYENLGASGLLTTFLSKKGAISEGDFLMDRVSDYFSEFKPLVDEWHGQIHLTDTDANATIIHDHILQMLVTFIAKLEDEIPIPIPIPLPCPPSQSPTLQPTAGPSTLPRTGTSWPLTGQPGPRCSQRLVSITQRAR
ncbi:hypothetical protein F4604DRAFT_1939013 [Suillus subluteus]|nr:hypothetical protein F4604DRAFT_1939013 [Suillus subluteus]